MTMDTRDQDPVFLFHKGGKIEVRPTIKVRDQDSLSLAYTPGAAHAATNFIATPFMQYRLPVGNGPSSNT